MLREETSVHPFGVYLHLVLEKRGVLDGLLSENWEVGELSWGGCIAAASTPSFHPIPSVREVGEG
jgi:hypothetical protein